MKRKWMNLLFVVACMVSCCCLVACDSEDVDIVLDEYQNLEDTYVWGWCGPSAVSWAYMGLYDEYEGVALDGETVYDLADYVLENYSHSMPWNGETAQYMLGNDIRDAVEDITGGEYTVVPFYSHQWDDAKEWLTDHDLPLFSLVSITDIDITDPASTYISSHWRVVYGVYYTVEENVRYYRLHDNGAQGGTWMEKQDPQVLYLLYGLKKAGE